MQVTETLECIVLNLWYLIAAQQQVSALSQVIKHSSREMKEGVAMQIQFLQATQTLKCIVINHWNLTVFQFQFCAVGQVTEDSRSEMSDEVPA